MSGHSKWKTIKHQKGVADARRGQLFTRLAREIAIAAREGGGSLDSNFKLRLAVDKARSNSMPKENIERAIKRGSGEDKDGVAFESIMYEGYGPHGVGLLIQVVTDNRNRSISDLRRVVTRANGSMAEGGAVSWQFTRKAYITVPAAGNDPDKIFEIGADAGADDVLPGDEEIEIYAPAENYHTVVQALDQAGVKITESELRMEPNQKIELDPEPAVQVMKLIEQLEELDDVQNVYSNLEFTDAAIAALEAA
ncbi:MAG: YebC/PmpR family DNA-binding transcriptional regulator [Anaerolineales bacterium]|nr:YebC/PmpR family DNA-binding transcriptional regulator [Anaerolineales bacterium]